jgi:hypothetical protein
MSISIVAAGFSLRLICEREMTREEELQKEGWEKRFTIDEPRLSEMLEQYQELGFEVLLEPVDPSSEECTVCITASPDRYRTIYTRRKS